MSPDCSRRSVLFLLATCLVTAGMFCATHTARAQDIPVFLPIASRSAPPPPVPADMVSIPVGPFQMGCSPDDTACLDSEKPLHTVALDAYFIDKYEVTNARYAACVGAGGCTAPHDTSSKTRTDYYGSVAYANYPVINVDWFQATALCAWEGKRLPTEAEWEKAARGSSDTRIYPWGSAAPDCTRLNYVQDDNRSCVGDTAAVGSYPLGASPYGVMDMSGNVWEWVSDWMGSDYYATSPANNPQGPATGTSRVLRGGSWGGYPRLARTSIRAGLNPDQEVYTMGFRCAYSP